MTGQAERSANVLFDNRRGEQPLAENPATFAGGLSRSLTHRNIDRSSFPMPTILLTNDDGYVSAGLHALKNELASLGRVIVIAPDRERSGVSHSITLIEPLRLSKPYLGDDLPDDFVVNGSPADCVKIGLFKVLPAPPDLIVSGINRGANTGINIHYSGTVAAASEGAIAGIPSFAISRASMDRNNFGPAAAIGRIIAARILKTGLPAGVLLNVNVPANPLGEPISLAQTHQGRRRFRDTYLERVDPRNDPYVWLIGEKLEQEPEPDSDDDALRRGIVSITPLMVDRTWYHDLNVDGWALEG